MARLREVRLRLHRDCLAVRLGQRWASLGGALGVHRPVPLPPMSVPARPWPALACWLALQLPVFASLSLVCVSLLTLPVALCRPLQQPTQSISSWQQGSRSKPIVAWTCGATQLVGPQAVLLLAV